MFVEFHDLNDNVLMVNFGAILYIAPYEESGSMLYFNGGSILRVKETVKEIRLNLMQMAMQNQIKSH